MWSVCKKELRQFFSSLTGYIAIIVFLSVNGLMLFVFRDNIFDFGYATLDQFFGLAPWVLLLLIPAITMRSFSEEFKTGTFELLQTRPLRHWEIVMGKYLGSFIVVLIALLPTLVYFFSIQALSSNEGLDTGGTIGSYIGLFFLTAVFTAIGICSSSFTSNAVVAFIVSLIACALIYYGFDAISKLPALENGMDYYIAMAGIDFHYKSISRGLIDTRDVIYFLSLIFLFLAITNRNLVVDKKAKGIPNIFTSRFGWILLLVVLFGLNYLGTIMHSRFDLTKEKRFTLSKPTRQLLRNIDDEVQITVLLKGDFPAKFRKLTDAVSEFLENCRSYSSNRLHVQFVDPFKIADDSAAAFITQTEELIRRDSMAIYRDTSGSFQSQLRYALLMEKGSEQIVKEVTEAYTNYFVDSIAATYDIGSFVLQAPSKVGDKQVEKKVLPGAIVSYKGKSIGINLFKGMRGYGTTDEQMAALYNDVEATLEYRFASAIQKLTLKERPLVGYALGNGEEWGYNVDDAVRTLFKEYNFDTVNLKTLPYIPTDFKALVVLKPKTPFTDDDLVKIDQYVMNGGRVFWMIDNMYAEMDSLYKSRGFTAFDRGLNLEPLLFRYGAKIRYNLLQDMQNDKLPQVSGGDGSDQQRRLVDWPYFPVLNGTNHPITKNIDGVRAIFPNTVDTVEDEPGIKKTYLLKSSSNARVLQAPAIVNFDFMEIAPDVKQFNVKDTGAAVLLEGQFPSFFANNAPMYKRKFDSLHVPFPSVSPPDTRMIVVADGDIATNQVSPSAGPLPMGMNFFTRYTFANKEFFLNCMEYLVNPSDILTTRGKSYTLRLLDPVKVNKQRTTWQLINIAVPILLVILFGWIYSEIRKRRYAGPAATGNKQ